MKRQEIPTYNTTSRLEAFSDGVFAIIITIMVLEIKVPQLAEEFTKADFYSAVEKLAPKILSYAMSFLVVGIYWVNHFNFLHSLKHTDGKFLWYNNFLLFWLSLTPVPTAFLGEHSHSVYAVMTYATSMFFTSLSFSVMTHYALFKGNMRKDDISHELKRRSFAINIPANVLYFLAIVLAPVSIYISWVIFFIVPLMYFMPRSLDITAIFD